MYRGTTPIITINVKTSLALNNVKKCLVTIKSENGLKEKTFEDVSVDADNSKIILPLTQEDTLYFENGKVEIQVRLKMNNDSAYASTIAETELKRILKEGII